MDWTGGGLKGMNRRKILLAAFLLLAFNLMLAAVMFLLFYLNK